MPAIRPSQPKAMKCMAPMLMPKRRAPSGIVAEGIELPPGGRVADQRPGGDDADRHDQHRQRELGPGAVRLLELEQHGAMRPPVRQIVDRHAAGEEHQQAEKDVEGRDRDDDRDDPEIVDQGGVDRSRAQCRRSPRKMRPMNQSPPPIGARASATTILHDRGGDGEGDVDAAGDQHHQQPDGEDQI